jgi:hypothetical protein
MPSWSCGIARQDCEDLMAADAVITFTEIPNTILATGGRHVEFGLALAQGNKTSAHTVSANAATADEASC